MARSLGRANFVLWCLLLAAVSWIALGDRVLTHLAYAVERGRIQASSHELAELQAGFPELNAVARAFKLVAKVARPGVVHIRVSGGERRFSEEEMEEFLREHLDEFMRENQKDEDAKDATPETEEEMKQKLQ